LRAAGIRKPSQKAKYSRRAFVVRNGPDSGRRVDMLPGPSSANKRLAGA
jgi:hypothetical protein